MLSNTGGQLKEEPVQRKPSSIRGQNHASINTGSVTLPHDVGDCKLFSTYCRVFISLNFRIKDTTQCCRLDLAAGLL